MRTIYTKRPAVIIAISIGCLFILCNWLTGSLLSFRVEILVEVSTTPLKIENVPKKFLDDSKKIIKPRKEILKIDGKEITVRVAGPEQNADIDILLLHDSATWEQVGTLQFLASAHHRVVAVDLPGYGETSTSYEPSNKLEFMNQLTNLLHMNWPVIISTSFGGPYVVPYLLAKATVFIAVAPTKDFQSQMALLKLPTLVIIGEKDEVFGSVIIQKYEKLLKVPKMPVQNRQYTTFKIPGAGQSCYKDNPKLFHKAIYTYLLQYGDPKLIQLHD